MSLRQLHLILGLLVSLPVLGWSISGFFLALPPGAVSGEPYQAIEPAKLAISPARALEIAQQQQGADSKITALSLEQRSGKAVYSAFGSGGGVLIDASTGTVSKPPPTPPSTKLLRHAHFYNFAGSWKTTILLLFSLLSACSTLSGLVLAVRWWGYRPRMSKSVPHE